jgi:hypothetical protein
MADTMNARIDHLVVVAASLAQGAAWVRASFGAEPAAGGQHLFMGTHNLLLRVGADVYLEIIAIDPAQPQPARARWFEMDRPSVQAAVRDAPRLFHFVARTDDLDAALRRAKHAPGAALAAARGQLRWRISVPEDGALIEQGLVPTLIQWQGATPSGLLPDSAVRLHRVVAKHPEPARLQTLYDAIGLEGVTVEAGTQCELIAEFDTPAGALRLNSKLGAQPLA